MRRVVIITNTNPFNPEASHYAHDAKTECLRHGEAPLSACEFTAENKGGPDIAGRMTSLNVVEAWLKCADALVVFVDQGVSACRDHGGSARFEGPELGELCTRDYARNVLSL